MGASQTVLPTDESLTAHCGLGWICRGQMRRAPVARKAEALLAGNESGRRHRPRGDSRLGGA